MWKLKKQNLSLPARYMDRIAVVESMQGKTCAVKL